MSFSNGFDESVVVGHGGAGHLLGKVPVAGVQHLLQWDVVGGVRRVVGFAQPEQEFVATPESRDWAAQGRGEFNWKFDFF